ncbi:MAG: enoyl-CoA hydratase, partial [Acidobacteria bacterium]|nr:enoyl-CoA hydratase [Acidobacteriota bacterium]
ARTLELLLQGKALTAQRAADLGLVEEVVPGEQLLPRALERAAQLAARNQSLRT